MKTILNIKNGMMFLVITLILLSSCNEEFLEPNPLSFYAPENVLINADGLQAVLDNALAYQKEEFYGQLPAFTTTIKYSDVAYDGVTDKATPWQDLNNQMLPDGVYNDNNYTKIGWYWDDSYKIIKDCNTVINRIDEAEFPSEAQKNILLGGAYFLRAHRYYSKTLQYGDVPFVIEEVKEPRVDFFTTTKESIWKKMINDLEFAVQHVPEANQVHQGQITKAACKHLLSKYYLLEGRFDDAIKQTSDIIDGGIHNLTTQRFGIDKDISDKDVIWDLHRTENKTSPSNSEGLWVIVGRHGMEGGDMSTISMRNLIPYYGLTGAIKTPDGENGISDRPGLEIPLVEKTGRGVGRTRLTHHSQHGVWQINGVEDFDDFRHRTDNGNWITMESLVYNNPNLKGESEWYGKNLRLYNDAGVLLCLDTIRTWYDWPHYKVWIPDPDRNQPQGGPGDWYIYRLAETYLLRAEAYVWKGDWQKAAEDINIIRQRANAKYMFTSSDVQQQGIGAVLDERNRELFFEELRKVELTRLAIIYARTGIPSYNGKTYNMDRIHEDNFWYDRVMEYNVYNKGVFTPYGNEYTCSPFHIFWPIPSYAINSNTGGVINQNEGYPGTGRNVEPLVYDGE